MFSIWYRLTSLVPVHLEKAYNETYRCFLSSQSSFSPVQKSSQSTQTRDNQYWQTDLWCLQRKQDYDSELRVAGDVSDIKEAAAVILKDAKFIIQLWFSSQIWSDNLCCLNHTAKSLQCLSEDEFLWRQIFKYAFHYKSFQSDARLAICLWLLRGFSVCQTLFQSNATT